LVVVGAVILTVTGYCLLKPSAPINPRAYARIKAGMTREEVEAVLGLPAGDYRDAQHVASETFPSVTLSGWGDFGQYCYPDGCIPDMPVAVPVLWLGSDYKIQVGFGDADRVTGCHLAGRPAGWSVLDRVRTHFGW